MRLLKSSVFVLAVLSGCSLSFAAFSADYKCPAASDIISHSVISPVQNGFKYKWTGALSNGGGSIHGYTHYPANSLGFQGMAYGHLKQNPSQSVVLCFYKLPSLREGHNGYAVGKEIAGNHCQLEGTEFYHGGKDITTYWHPTDAGQDIPVVGKACAPGNDCSVSCQ